MDLLEYQGKELSGRNGQRVPSRVAYAAEEAGRPTAAVCVARRPSEVAALGTTALQP